MKLSETIQHINAALNYPALTYVDVSFFFDAAIAELNTTLHTSIPTVSEMVKEFRQKMSKHGPNVAVLTSDPADDGYEIEIDKNIATLNHETYYDVEKQQFGIWDKYNVRHNYFDTAKAIYIKDDSDGVAQMHMYQANVYGNEAIWLEIPTDPEFECEISDYLPEDWILLWLIPYVCFKYTVRDGGTASSFADELTQGFQQLQETYNVPSKVVLATVADKPAYTTLVEENLPNLNIVIPVKAILPEMKHSRNLNAIFGSFYDRGGF